MVCCFGRADLFLPLCSDGRRYKLRDCAFQEQAAAGGGVCTGWGWRELLSLGFAFTNPSTIRCFLSRSMQDMSFFGLCCPLATTGGSMGACSKAQLWIRSDKTFVDKTSADKTSEPAGEKPQAAESTEMTV